MTKVPHPAPDHREDGNADSAFPSDLAAASARPSRNRPATQMRMLAKRKPAHARTRRGKNTENKDYKYLIRYAHYNAPVLENILPQNKRKGVAKVLGNIAPQQNPKNTHSHRRGVDKVRKCNATEHGKHTKKRTPTSTGKPFLIFATPHEEYAHHVFDKKCPKYWKT